MCRVRLRPITCPSVRQFVVSFSNTRVTASVLGPVLAMGAKLSSPAVEAPANANPQAAGLFVFNNGAWKPVQAQMVPELENDEEEEGEPAKWYLVVRRSRLPNTCT